MNPSTRIAFAAGLAGLAALAVGACGGNDGPGGDEAGPTKTIDIQASEYKFAGDPSGIVAGDTIQFVVSNVGGLDHEMEVLTAESRSLGKTGRIPPGASDTVTVEFADAGVYLVICDIDDHRSRGQSAQFTVAEP